MVFSKQLSALGDFGQFSGEVLRAIFRRRFTGRSVLRQMDRVGVESLTVVTLCAFFIGLVMVIQMASLLKRFNAETEVSTVIGLSFVREIGPVFAAIMFTGRIGTAIAAELASMLASEQIDALRVMGANPISRLVAPRVLASVLMLPALTIVADLVGIFSGYVAAAFAIGMTPGEYLNKTLMNLLPSDIGLSMVKAVCFGLFIGLISSYMGLRSGRSTEAVGTATTGTMVNGVLGILFMDFLLTKVFLAWN